MARAKRPCQFFRAGVGALVVDGEGRVAAFERLSTPGSWQLPQGGVKEGETLLEGVYRELTEETALVKSSVELIDEYPGWLVYELPEARWSPKVGRGQAQKWFLFRLVADPASIQPQAPEFGAYKWTTMAALAEEVVSFRRSVYRELLRYFASHLA